MPEPRIHTSEYPPVQTPTTPIWQTVLAGAAERGDHPALIDGISGQTITYAQLAQMVERMAAGFAENGVQPGRRRRAAQPEHRAVPGGLLRGQPGRRDGDDAVRPRDGEGHGQPARRQQGDDGDHRRAAAPGRAGGGRRPAGLDLRPGRGPPQRAGAARVDRPGAERAGGRGPGRRRPPLLQRHHQPAQGRDAHPRQHRREPGPDRRAAHDGPRGPHRRRPAVLPHLRHDRADERGPAEGRDRRRPAAVRPGAVHRRAGAAPDHPRLRGAARRPGHGQAPGVRGPGLLRAGVHPVRRRARSTASSRPPRPSGWAPRSARRTG